MKRRDLLKALGVLPVAGAVGSWANVQSESMQHPKTTGKVHTLQILLEGAFAVVLAKGHPTHHSVCPKARDSKTRNWRTTFTSMILRTGRIQADNTPTVITLSWDKRACGTIPKQTLSVH